MAKKIALILLMFIAFSPYFSSARAQTFRTTTFDDRQACQENKGIWREFGNGCVDECESKFDKYVTCTKELKYACDCGRGRCWRDGKCLTIDAYTKIYNKESEERAKVLETKKKEREERIKNDPNLSNYLQNLYYTQKAATPATGANGAPAPAGQPAPPQQPNAITQAAPVRDLPTSPDAVTQVPAVVAPNNSQPQTPISVPPQGTPQQVPPAFLEKEKRDQEKQRQQQQNSSTAGAPIGNPTGKDAPVALPLIPLPN